MWETGDWSNMIVFFTDLDGTLLDHDTYDWRPARPTLELAKAGGHAVVLCTSKAKAEVEALRESMEIPDPIIVENGGAVYVPAGYFGTEAAFGVGPSTRREGWDVLELGTPYPALVEALRRASEASGVVVRGFASMTVEEVAERTGLPAATAQLAHAREYDEPFVVVRGDEGALCAAIEAMGFSWTRGGRFFHIVRGSDKSKAVAALTSLYRANRRDVRTVGLGDGLNDAGFLLEVDSAWLIPSKQTAELTKLVPRARVAPAAGPSGWAHAVGAELDAD